MKEKQEFRTLILHPDDDTQVSMLVPQDFGDRGSLMDYAWIDDGFAMSAYHLIHKRPRRIAGMGSCVDLSIENLLSFGKVLPDRFYNLYFTAWSITEPAKRIFPNQVATEVDFFRILTKGRKKYLVNHSQKICLDMQKYIRKNTRNGRCLSPLPLLTAVGNLHKDSSGRGDYTSSVGKEDVGSWALDLIEVTEIKPIDYQEEMYFFIPNTNLEEE